MDPPTGPVHLLHSTAVKWGVDSAVTIAEGGGAEDDDLPSPVGSPLALRCVQRMELPIRRSQWRDRPIKHTPD